jgi:hypothetical protein
MFKTRIHKSESREGAESPFRYYLHDRASAFHFRLAGALVSEAAGELEQCWRTAASTIGGRAFTVDLSSVTSADETGRELLRRWHGDGAQFIARTARARLLAESITGQSLDAVAPATQPFLGWRSLRFAALVCLAVLLLALPVKVWANSAVVATPAATAGPGPKLVLARYAAALEQSKPSRECGSTSVEIEASLPKLGQRGRLQAIRHFTPLQAPQYQVLHIEGDRTVRQQVIARYLSAEAQAEAMPASSVAVSPANYKFHYAGVIGAGPGLTYVFQITPRKKRAGLIQGELWIDAATGIAVRQSGYLVKRPSVFLRRVVVVKDTDIRDGVPDSRITHLDIYTRLVGRAELIIRERPFEPDTIEEIASVSNETREVGNDGYACSITE